MINLRDKKSAEALEAIRDEAVSGSYQLALAKLENLLVDDPEAIEAMRLKANILELRALDGAQYHSKKLLNLPDFVEARQYYENILSLDPRNTLALADLCDHYKNLGAYDKSINYLEQAAALLAAGECRLSLEEERQEILDRIIEIRREHPSEALASLEATFSKLIS
jgi:tetratricopeptide (TPR) repeat protein